jgi:hypothetical protein
MSLSLPHIFKLTSSGHNNKSSQREPSGKTSYFLGSYFPEKKKKEQKIKSNVKMRSANKNQQKPKWTFLGDITKTTRT